MVDAVSRLSPVTSRKPRVRIRPGWTEDPTGFAICDGCGLPTPHTELRQNMEYRGGMDPEPTGFRVCARCEDVPNAYFQKQLLRPDPVPLKDARPDDHGTDTLDSYTSYATGALPDASIYEVGSQIDVTGLGADPVRAYSNGVSWRAVDTDEILI